MQTSKTTITKLFGRGLLAIVGGFLLSFTAVWISAANGGFVLNGPDVGGIQGTVFGWSMFTIAILGLFVAACGALAHMVSWIGAVLNTYQLEDKTWFAVLLVLGVFSFGFVAMVVYVMAGPDGTAVPPKRPISTTPLPTL
jgi:hypothetical protein